MNVDALLESVAGRGLLWRARAGGAAAGADTPATLSTGHERLDACLPGNGWPAATLIELLLERHGIGELRLLLPALVQLCARDDEDRSRWLVWIRPPFDPYVPALAGAGIDPDRILFVTPSSTTETLWAAEQTLRSGNCAAVLAWVDEERPGAVTDDRWLRRLKLAAEQGACFGVLFRPLRQQQAASPAALRLRLLPGCSPGMLDVEVLKSRGGAPARVRDVFGCAAHCR